ncbi:MAG TPA: glycosyltransferase family 2 protein [Kiritimatiellia bacterium]|nr:glycosyltransferase family 2 protein [Kiritimatiellia bacterium]
MTEPTPNRCRVTAIVLTRDEEINIEPCLRSLAWADEVVIVDSHSTDRTVAIAQTARPDVRILQHPFTDFGDQRNWALDHTAPRNDWILFVDADERITPACAKAISAAIADPGDKAGFFLTCRNFFMGRWIKHCTLYPSWQLRLLKRGQVRFRKEGHGQREVSSAPLGYLREPYDHFGFSKGVEHWKARHEIYAANEAELIFRLRSEPLAMRDLFSPDPVIRRRGLKRLAARTPFRPWLRFFYIYIWRRGFLDGKPGFTFAMLRFGHEVRITAKLAESIRQSRD